MRTHSQEHPYGAHVFTPSLFFINPDTCLENSTRTFLCPFCAYAAFIHEAPDLANQFIQAYLKTTWLEHGVLEQGWNKTL